MYAISSARPDLDGLIDTACGSQLTLHVEAADEVVVRVVYLAVASTHCEVPNTNRFIVSCAHEEFTVRMEMQISDPIVVARKGQHASTTPGLKDANLLVARSSSDILLELAGLELLLRRVNCYDGRVVRVNIRLLLLFP